MKKNGSHKKLSKEIVRSWFDTVLNPVYFRLIGVNELLRNRDLTWNGSTKKFTLIDKFSEFIDFNARLNYKQLCQTEYPELVKLNEEYDDSLEELRIASSNLFDKLINSPNLKSLLLSKINEYEKSGHLQDADYIRKGDSIRWVAEYLINNERQLFSNNVLHPIWNSESEIFFDIFDDIEIKELKLKFDESISKFKKIVEKIISNVESKLLELSQKYGVPISVKEV
jgi:hypothetical protein